MRAAAAAGYPATGIWYEPANWSATTTRAVAAALDEARLVALDIEVIWIRTGATVSDDARRLIETGGALGARNVLIVSANPDPLETRRQYAALCQLAARAGMRAVFEFLMISSVRTLADALSIVRDVDHPAGGVLIDALHLSRCGAAPADVARIAPSLLPYAQLCDGPAALDAPDAAAYLDDAVDGRSAPGEGGLPLRALLAALPPTLPLSLEVRSKRYRDRYPDPVARARAVLDVTRRFLDAVR